MSQDLLPHKIEAVAEVFQTPGGALVIRPKGGRKLRLTAYARTRLQVDGSTLLEACDEEIETEQAMEILGLPWSTLRRLIESGALKAWKRSPARWTLSLQEVLQHKEQVRTDPEYWERLPENKEAVQGDLKLV